MRLEKFISNCLWAVALLPNLLPDPIVGIDQIDASEWQWIFANRAEPRIAVLTHRAAVDRHGRGLIPLLLERGITPQIVFAPEHGLDSLQDQMEMGIFREELSHAPVHFFYGATPRLTLEQMALFDLLIVDLFDVGVRPYTYPGTVAAILESLRDTSHRIVILDRPNPLGFEASGPVLEENLGRNLFTLFEVPYRHGMTLGELTLWYDARHGMGMARSGRLKVIPVQGLSRRMTAAMEVKTRPWIAPSPALTTPEQAWLYAWLAPLEALDLSVGRESPLGTHAFRRIGAPWISTQQSEQWARELQSAGFRGVTFKPLQWIQRGSRFDGSACRGVSIEVNDGGVLKAYGFEQTIQMLAVTRSVFGNQLDLEFNQNRLDLYLGAARWRQQIERGERDFRGVGSWIDPATGSIQNGGEILRQMGIALYGY